MVIVAEVEFVDEHVIPTPAAGPKVLFWVLESAVELVDTLEQGTEPDLTADFFKRPGLSPAREVFLRVDGRVRDATGALLEFFPSSSATSPDVVTGLATLGECRCIAEGFDDVLLKGCFT